MTDLTPIFSQLLQKDTKTEVPKTYPPAEKADEFLKEAHRINSHISSLLKYLHSIRPSYLSITSTSTSSTNTTTNRPSPSRTPSSKSPGTGAPTTPLSDTDRDKIDTSTSQLLHDLSTSISTLSSAESLRHDTQSNLLKKKYGHSGAASRLLWKWAAGDALSNQAHGTDSDEGKSGEQVRAEEMERVLKTVRENVLWFLRRGLEDVVVCQRGMVERRIERVKEKEKSALYKVGGRSAVSGAAAGSPGGWGGVEDGWERSGKTMGVEEVKAIEAELSAEQLQLFAEENDSLVRYYEDTLGKVQNAEKSLLEISSLQQTLVSHLSTQEEYINQLVTDASNTETNIGMGNKELKRASERRSAAQAVFWGTVGLCGSLVVWDLIF